MKLQEKLNAMKRDSIAGMPPEVVAVLLQATDNLVKSGIADRAIKVGEKLPDFSLSDEGGNLVSSKDLLANGPLVISFYRGGW